MAAELLELTAWELARTDADQYRDPSQLPRGLEWLPARVPGTAADAYRAAGRWSDDAAFDFDQHDWWFRCRFESQPGGRVLRLGGIATLADVWLNGQHVLHSENMFHSHDLVVDVDAENELVVVCRSLNQRLAKRAPRPHWRTRLVESQALRWIRTCFFGRMPALPPHCAPVGVWRRITVDQRDTVSLSSLSTRYDGAVGTIEIALTGAERVRTAWIEVDGRRHRVELSWHGAVLGDSIDIADVEPWFPATHGTPRMYACRVIAEVDGVERVVDERSVGFRSIAVDRANGDFRLAINGVDVFCRGACWQPLDPVRLFSERAELRAAVEQFVRSGANMLRVAGTGVYEQDELFDVCDELGVLVWHDLAFANVDQPLDDETYRDSVEREVEQFLRRAAGHPSMVVVCGGSEVEQQAAMMGVDPAVGRNRVGREVLPALARRVAPGIVTVACSPSGGDFAFHVNEGVSHYFGVGAYRRPLLDARLCGARFVSESLAFAAVPCRQTIDEWGIDPRELTAPAWKQRVPRDRGTAWDFDDVRDHYVEELFAVRALDVRYADPERYLDLGRAAVAEAVRSTVSELRRPSSRCAGVICISQRDAEFGPGWGLVDAAGRTKSSYYGFQAASRPRCVTLHDEGLNGVVAAVHNDSADELVGELVVRLFAVNGVVIDEASCAVKLQAAQSTEFGIDALFGRFLDLSYAYRFGPAYVDVIEASVLADSGEVLHRTHLLPGGHSRPRRADLDMAAWFAPDRRSVTVSTAQFAHFVSLEIPGSEPADDWFHLSPGEARTVLLDAPVERAVGTVRALNGYGLQPITAEQAS